MAFNKISTVLPLLVFAFSVFHATEALTEAQRTAVVDYHNQLRSQMANGEVKDQSGTLPAGQNIYKFSYNATIESIAQATADGCTMEHSSSGYGENLFMNSWAMDNLTQALVDAANSWWGEKDQCPIVRDNLTVTTAVWDACGHWVPMAWSHTTQIACGASVCGPASWCGDCKNTTMVVCNYINPTDDSGNTLIYERGSSACTADSQCTWYNNSTCDTSLGLCAAPSSPVVAGN